jgi:hypothetical protein
MKSLRQLVLLSTLTNWSVGASQLADRCTATSFKDVLPAAASIESITSVANGSSYGEGAADIGFPAVPRNLPALCAVIVNVNSSNSSNYRFGIFLPADWNSRFLAVGNGGFAGGINWMAMGSGVRYGHSVISTDTGHNSTSGDVTWALNNKEKQLDFGFRAIHGSVQLGKMMTKAYYGTNITYSYYSGGSTGGRQGLKEAQFDPTSFDGMIIGAPAWWTSHLQTWTTKVAMYNLPLSAANSIPTSMFSVIGKEVSKQCDALDGLSDGIISYPDKCNFDPTPLLCSSPGASASACLTQTQLTTLKNIYGQYLADGKFAFPGMEPGSEAQWAFLLGSPAPSTLGYQYVQYFLLNSQTWNWTQYNDTMVWEADSKDPGQCTADDIAALAKFRDRGGKIFMYHGLSDGLIPPGSSDVFYQKMVDTLGGSGQKPLDSWYRYFKVPGMQHVSGTAVNAPWYFAGADAAGSLGQGVYSTPGFEDAQHDAMLAMIDWVEKAKPMDQIIATTWKTSNNPSSGVLRQRPLCPMPKRQTYDGKGDLNKPESFACS